MDAFHAPDNGIGVDYYATSFYADGQFHDVSTSSDIIWTLHDSQGNLIDSEADGGGFLSSDANNLSIYSTLTEPNLTVRATYTNPQGETFVTTVPLTANVTK